MVEPSEHVRKTLEDFKRQLAGKMADVARTLSVVNALEEELGVPKTSLAGPGISWNIALGEEARMVDSMSAGSLGSDDIRPDEYLGEAPLDAAKKYLRRIRKAAHFDQIAEAVSKGGAAVKGGDWKPKLEESLTRSTREVVKVQEHTFGLVEFYTADQLRGLRSIRRQTPAKATGLRRKRRGRPAKRDSATKLRGEKASDGEQREAN